MHSSTHNHNSIKPTILKHEYTIFSQTNAQIHLLLSSPALHPATYAAAHAVSGARAAASNFKVNHVDGTYGSGCCGLLLLCIKGDAKRFLLEEVTNGETDVKPNNQPEKSSSKGNPILGSVPTVDANNKNTESNTSDEDNHSEDDKDESYKSNGNPSGSSTERHHLYITTCPPTRPDCEKNV